MCVLEKNADTPHGPSSQPIGMHCHRPHNDNPSGVHALDLPRPMSALRNAIHAFRLSILMLFASGRACRPVTAQCPATRRHHVMMFRGRAPSDMRPALLHLHAARFADDSSSKVVLATHSCTAEQRTGTLYSVQVRPETDADAPDPPDTVTACWQHSAHLRLGADADKAGQLAVRLLLHADVHQRVLTKHAPAQSQNYCNHHN
jgi:hypothetical protein